jgi:sugar-specific transcriptional regulator TrmB
MSHERVVKTLTSLGLSQTDANVYVYLATKGPQKAEKIGDALKLQEQLLNKSLENLKGKGIVNPRLEQSTVFFALPFDKALELLVKAHLKEAQVIEQEREAILSRWRAIVSESTG